MGLVEWVIIRLSRCEVETLHGSGVAYGGRLMTLPILCLWLKLRSEDSIDEGILFQFVELVKKFNSHPFKV